MEINIDWMVVAQLLRFEGLIYIGKGNDFMQRNWPGKYVTHDNKRYLMSARLNLGSGEKQLVKFKENNKKKTPYFPYIFKSSNSIFISLVSLFNCVLDNAQISYLSKIDIRYLLL